MARELAASALGIAPGSYLYTLALSDDKQTYATVASDDSLTLFDLTLRLRGKAAAVHAGVSSLACFNNGFATAGRDGLIRCWDSRAQRRNIEIASPKGSGLSAIASHEHIIAAGTESTKEGLADVDVLLFDTRNARVPLRTYSDSHTDTVTQLKFHPAQANILLSGSEDGLVSLFDVSHVDEEDAIQQVLNPRAGVHCAGFLSPTEVYVLTGDENFLAYSLPETNDDEHRSILEVGDVRPLLNCTYIIDILPIETSFPLMAVGNHVDQTLHLVQLDASQSYAFGQVINLPGAHTDEIVRDVLIREQDRRALSCGEDGQVKVWDVSG